jgi:predicted secreted Zn-dependent protease
MSVDIPDTAWRTYDLDATSLPAAAAAIADLREAARTEWFPRYAYTTSRGRLVSAAVVVRTVVTMPRWTGEASATPAERNEWRRFLSALRAHEQGHLELVHRHLGAIDTQLIGASAKGARERWSQSLAALAAASDAYDRATDHGRLRGTRLHFGGGAA